MRLIDAEKLTLELENMLNKIKENSDGESNCDENSFVTRGQIMGINFALIEIANASTEQPEIKIKEKTVCPVIQMEKNKKMINQEFFTKDEQAILRSMRSQFKWIARDADGTLCVYEGEPKRDGFEFVCSNPKTEFAGMEIFEHIFKGVTFENSPIRFRGEVVYWRPIDSRVIDATKE